MAKLIYLSPSDQTANKYAYGNTNEAVQCRKISDACAISTHTPLAGRVAIHLQYLL